MSIPKKVHYCWFGGGEMPQLAIDCIATWKKHLLDYEFVLWNEETFDWNSNQFTKEAYECGKYAFVTDYVRLWALYHQGGVYMDTDVEVIRPLDTFLEHRAFTGCESSSYCVAATMGAEKGHPWVEDLLEDYKGKKFVLGNKELNETPNTALVTQITKDKYGWKPNNDHQVLKEDLHIYPREVFCGKVGRTGELRLTKDTATVHHFAGSWLSGYKKLKRKVIRLIGPRVAGCLARILKKGD